jgi:hypothetical protein|tara:strand:+ start:12218 stop:12886 length:669 start_codon:yes stop_codon:yes gene_type:complete
MSNIFFFAKYNNFISKDLVEKLLVRFNTIYQKKLYTSKNGSQIYDLKENDILKEPLFLSLLEKIQKKFKLITNTTDLNFDKLWLVNTSPNNNKKNDLPYIAHIDKRRYLKAMVYLHDVNIEHGPINLGLAKSMINMEEKRKKLPYDYIKRKLNTIKEKFIEGNLTAMTGKAGDVIFFDTNTPHKAGIIQDTYYRKVLRFDFERPSFNPKQSILNRIINKLYK